MEHATGTGRAIVMMAGVLVLGQLAMFLALQVGAPAASASTPDKSQRFAIVKRTSHYVVVECGSRHLVVYQGTNIVRLRGLPKFLVVKRGRSYYLMVRLPAPAKDPVAALKRARPGSTVVVGPGTFLGNLTVPSGVRVVGAGAGSSWLQGSIRFSSDSTFSHLRIGPADSGTCGLSNAEAVTTNTTFDRCRFRGGGGSDARNASVVWLGHAVSYLTFTHCDVECNLAMQPAGKEHNFTNVYIQPAVVPPSIHDVLFKDCRFGVSNGVTSGCPMFNVEIWSDASAPVRTRGFRDINFEGCVFESGQGELLNYSGSTVSSDHVTPNDGYSHVIGCVFKGDGAPGYVWNNSLVIEQGCGYITVDGCTFYRGSGSAIVTQRGSEQDHHVHCTITDNIFDQTDDNHDTGIARLSYNVVEVNGRYNTVRGNTIVSLPTEERPAIQIKGSDNTVTDNLITIGTTGWYAIDISPGANRNVVTGNRANKPIRDRGTDNVL